MGRIMDAKIGKENFPRALKNTRMQASAMAALCSRPGKRYRDVTDCHSFAL
jgi:hypothetical protein